MLLILIVLSVYRNRVKMLRKLVDNLLSATTADDAKSTLRQIIKESGLLESKVL